MTNTILIRCPDDLVDEWDRSSEKQRVLAMARSAWDDFLRRRHQEHHNGMNATHLRGPESEEDDPPLQNGHQ